MQRELHSLKIDVNKLKYKLEREQLFNIGDFKDNEADITFCTGFPNYSTMILCFNLLKELVLFLCFLSVNAVRELRPKGIRLVVMSPEVLIVRELCPGGGGH